MRTLLQLTLIVVGLTLLAGCTIPSGSYTTIVGSGRVITETRNVHDFSAVTVNGGAELSIERTGTESLTIIADDNIMPYLVTEVRGGTLVMELKRGFSIRMPPTQLKLVLTVKDLKSLELNGGVAADVQGLDADAFRMTVNGASAARMAGQVGRLEVSLSGAGAYDAENVQAKSASVTNNGAGAAVVRVSEQLNAEINGVGYVEYIGNPQVTKSVHGLGVVRQR